MCHLTLLYSCPLCLQTTCAHMPQRGGLAAKHFHKGAQRQRDACRTDKPLSTLCFRSSRVSMSDTVRPAQQCVGEEVNQARVRHIREALSGKTVDRRTDQQAGAWTRSINAERGYCYSGSCQGLHHPKGRGGEQKYVFTLDDAMFFVSLKSRRIFLI